MHRFIFLLLLPLVLFTAAAQERVMTLDQVIQTALELNLSVLQAESNVDAARAQVLSSYGNYLPSVSASGSWGRTQIDRGATTQVISGVAFTTPAEFRVTQSYSARLDGSLTLFDGFAREATLSSASARSEAAELTAVRTRQSVVFQAISSYLNALRSEQLVTVSEENLRRDRRQLERITESNRVGALSLADVYRQQSQVAADEVDLIVAQNNFNKARVDLLALIGLDARTEVTFADATVPTDLDSVELATTMERYADMMTLASRALASRPDYLSAQENLKANESSVTSARSGYFPSVGASASFSLYDEELSRITKNKTLNWGIGIRWNLFDGFSTNERLQLAATGQRNAEAALVQAERNITVEVKKAHLDLDAARKAYEASVKGLFSAAEDRKIAEERYNLGAGTLLDLLTANASYVRAQANAVNSVYAYLTAKYNLDYVVGERRY